MARAWKTLIVAVTMAVVATGTVVAQPAPWPAPRSTHGMVWHDSLRQTLLIGGVGLAEDSALWAWNGQQWRALTMGEPAGRAHFGFAHDTHRNRVILHGGAVAAFGVSNPMVYADTWEWDGRRWQRVSTAGPGVRDHHAMIYDPVRRVTLLFGGHAGESPALADTWAWNGREWRKLSDQGPPGRSTHRMVFDSQRSRVVLFGGWGANGLLNDTWAWDGSRWTQVANTGPSPRFATRMAYDAARDRVVLFGGRGQSADFGDTWEFDGQVWRQLEVAGPPIRNVHEMVYDAGSRSVLVFGGYNAPRQFNDLWTFNGTAWREIARTGPGSPRDGSRNPTP
jgi:hypothetical protein